MKSYWLLQLLQQPWTDKNGTDGGCTLSFQHERDLEHTPLSCSWISTRQWQFSSLFSTDKNIMHRFCSWFDLCMYLQTDILHTGLLHGAKIIFMRMRTHMCMQTHGNSPTSLPRSTFFCAYAYVYRPMRQGLICRNWGNHKGPPHTHTPQGYGGNLEILVSQTHKNTPPLQHSLIATPPPLVNSHNPHHKWGCDTWGVWKLPFGVSKAHKGRHPLGCK